MVDVRSEASSICQSPGWDAYRKKSKKGTKTKLLTNIGHVEIQRSRNKLRKPQPTTKEVKSTTIPEKTAVLSLAERSLASLGIRSNSRSRKASLDRCTTALLGKAQDISTDIATPNSGFIGGLKLQIAIECTGRQRVHDLPRTMCQDSYTKDNRTVGTFSRDRHSTSQRPRRCTIPATVKPNVQGSTYCQYEQHSSSQFTKPETGNNTDLTFKRQPTDSGDINLNEPLTDHSKTRHQTAFSGQENYGSPHMYPPDYVTVWASIRDGNYTNTQSSFPSQRLSSQASPTSKLKRQVAKIGQARNLRLEFKEPKLGPGIRTPNNPSSFANYVGAQEPDNRKNSRPANLMISPTIASTSSAKREFLNPGAPTVLQSLESITKVLVICCSCHYFHDIPSKLYASMASPAKNVEDEGLAAPGQIKTSVKCAWCSHEMKKECCPGYLATVHLLEKLY